MPDGAIARFGKGTIGDIAYSPDGSRLAVGGSIGIWLYDTVTLQAELEVIAGAPMSFSTHALSSRIAYRNVTTALADAKHLTISDMRLVEKLMVLLEFLQLLTERHAIPETTTLLPNYPNPFNYLSNSRLYTNINTCEKYYTKNLQLNDPALLGRVCKVFDTK